MAPSPVSLRPYQVAAEAEIRSRFRDGHRRILYVLPTGGGKTTVAASIIRQAAARGSRVAFLAHRKELVDQCSARLDLLGVDHGVVMAGHARVRPDAPVQVGSIQTVARRGLPAPPHIIFVDECHRVQGQQYLDALAAYPDALVIGITATPVRGDGRGLSPPFGTMVVGPSLSDLTADGYLVPARTYARPRPNLSGVRTTGGDYQTDELQAAMNKPEIVGDVVREWRRYADGRTTVVFAVGIEHSVALRDAFRADGVPAEHLDGSTPRDERERLLADLAAGRITVLTNCGVLSEGWDCPTVSCVSIVRPTKSTGLYLQMAGRALRPAPGKADCVILDHGGCVYRHGLVAADRRWELEPSDERRRAERRVADVADNARVCPRCDRAYAAEATECGCGYKFSRRRTAPREVAGDLVAVTEARVVTTDEKRARFRAYLHQQRTGRRKDGSPFAPNYAVARFMAIFGHPPRREWFHD